MSEFTTIIVQKPKWFRIAPLQTGFGKRQPYVIGFDTEAYNGRPFLLQFSLPNTDRSETVLIPTSGKMALDDFLEFLEPIAKEHGRKEQVIVVAWNLRYEYTQIFRNIHPDAWADSHFQLHFHDTGTCEGKPNDDWDVMIDAMNDKRYTFAVSFNAHRDKRGSRRDRYPIKVVDGMAFFNTGLDKAAGIVGIEGKDDFPEELKGKIPPAKALKDEAFLDYSRKDAWITRKIGEKIVEYHQYYDVRMTLSAPMYAAYVFRRRYLDGVIPLCDNDLEDAGLKSYHGGKNGYYLQQPAYFEQAYDYDVNAAYTSAMAALPDPVNSYWEQVFHYEPNSHALWYVLAHVQSCTYRAFQEINGRWHTWKDDGDLGFWITSYELDEALRRGEVLDIYECTGFIMRGESGTGCIRRFCDDMYELKQNGATPEERQMAKLCLNSLYGKLIQKVPASYDSVFPMFDLIEDEQGHYKIKNANMIEGGYKAGGLYHPALASLVTGSVRARIHAYEHKYRSLMTSTDGFLSLTPPDPADIGSDFGRLKVKQGSLSIWRERLYLFETDDHVKCHHENNQYDCHVFALHGFRGRLDDLRTIPLRPGKYEYQATQMVGLRDSLHRHNGKRYQPGQFVTLPYEVDLTNVSERSPIRATDLRSRHPMSHLLANG